MLRLVSQSAFLYRTLLRTSNLCSFLVPPRATIADSSLAARSSSDCKDSTVTRPYSCCPTLVRPRSMMTPPSRVLHMAGVLFLKRGSSGSYTRRFSCCCFLKPAGPSITSVIRVISFSGLGLDLLGLSTDSAADVGTGPERRLLELWPLMSEFYRSRVVGLIFDFAAFGINCAH